MEISTKRPDRTGRFLHGELETFKLREVIDYVQGEDEFNKNGHNALTLVKNDKLSIVLIYMEEGAILHDHHAPGQLTIMVVQGKILFTLDPNGTTQDIELSEKELLVLEHPKMHKVTALHESAILLTIVFDKVRKEA